MLKFYLTSSRRNSQTHSSVFITHHKIETLVPLREYFNTLLHLSKMLHYPINSTIAEVNSISHSHS